MSERTGLIAKLRAQRDHADDWRTTLAEDAADRLERDGAEIARLERELAMANDAAAKGEAGRALGTALEEAIKDNDALRAENEALKRELAEAREAKAHGTAAMRTAFGEELWQLGHPAYIVVHLRGELAKLDRLWKSATVERDRLCAENEALRAAINAAKERTP